MTYVITRLCQDCVDGDCLDICPADCILQHRPNDASSDLPNQLFIDPDPCLDCALCVTECPWGAIYPDDEIPEVFKDDIALNALAAKNPHDFHFPIIKVTAKPTHEEVEMNKQRWGLNDEEIDQNKFCAN